MACLLVYRISCCFRVDWTALVYIHLSLYTGDSYYTGHVTHSNDDNALLWCLSLSHLCLRALCQVETADTASIHFSLYVQGLYLSFINLQ